MKKYIPWMVKGNFCLLSGKINTTQRVSVIIMFLLTTLNVLRKPMPGLKILGIKDGETDMGRVFIKYGEPSTIEKHPNEKNTRPYEVWHYEVN